MQQNFSSIGSIIIGLIESEFDFPISSRLLQKISIIHMQSGFAIIAIAN